MARLMQPVEQSLAFDVLAEIAAGTTARIELCRIREPYEKLGMLVAVKRLHKHIAEDPQFANMFFDEVWMTAALHHGNVVDVVGWGNDDEGTYLAVELVQGVSLARLMKTVFETGEMFSERMVVYLGSEICAGLSAAHQLQGQNGEHLRLIHRDLTPGNVLIGFNGQIKITDFGLAKAKQRVTKTLTGLLKGHPQYMAPEMARGFEIDSRADLFSLGVVLFELFSGQHPWSGGNELEIMRVSATDPPKDLLTLRPKLDKELSSVVSSLLEKDPTRRFATADDVRARLLGWLDAHGYAEGNDEALGRFVRRNAMRQMRWFERAVTGELVPDRPSQMPPEPRRERAKLRDKGKSAPPPGRALRRTRRASDHGENLFGGPKDDPPTSDTTDVTDVASKLADLHALAETRPDRDPKSSSRTPKLLGQVDEGVDWGEEIPTVVQMKGERGPIPPKPGGGEQRDSDAPLPGFPMIDEDSDQRTTSVKAKPHYQSRARVPVPSMVDMESEEVPTQPVRGRRDAAVAAAIAGIPRRAPPVTAASSGLRSPSARPGAPRRGSAPPPPPTLKAPRSIPALPPPPAPGDRRGSYRPDAQENEATSLDGPRPAHEGELGGADDDAAFAAAGEVTQELLFHEADRLAVEALRYRDEADAAARLAKHQARLAKLAHDAAAMAAEAVRAASQGSLPRGVSLMRDARTLEDTVRREARAPSEAVPATGSSVMSHSRQASGAPSPSTAPTFAGAAALPASEVAPLVHPSPPFGSPSPAHPEAPSPPAFPSVPPPVAPTFNPAPTAPQTGMTPSGAPQSSFATQPRGQPFGRGAAPADTSLSAKLSSAWEAFTSRQVFGFPAPLALAAGGVMLVLLSTIIAMLLR